VAYCQLSGGIPAANRLNSITKSIRILHRKLAILYSNSGSVPAAFPQLSGSFPTAFWQLSRSFLAAFPQLSSSFPTAFWQLSYSFLTAFRQQTDGKHTSIRRIETFSL